MLKAIVVLAAFALSGQSQEPCRTCHPREVAAFESSPMGRSVGKAAVQTTGRVSHKASSSTLIVERSDSEMLHRIERRGTSASYPVGYSVGAGLVGYSYLVSIQDYLFLSPISYFTQTGAWDVAPGYETDKRLDFTRQVTSTCLYCHTGSVRLLAGTANRFDSPPFTAISCERCHGSARRHLVKPEPGSIINPAKLAPRERDSICEQCHLKGAVRILSPGRDWWDYQPGQATEQTFVTYLESSGSDGSHAISHHEQLAQSRCARESGGRLWCGTCHNPHDERGNRAAQLRQTCLSCHSSLFTTAKHQPAGECVTCHMPRLHPADVAHSATTDHRIVRRAQPDALAAHTAALLRAWREPDAGVAQRDLGLAYFEWATRQPDSEKIKHAYQLLSQLPQAARDAPVLAGLGSILLPQGQHALSARLFAQAAELEPANASYAYGLGVAHQSMGNLAAAVDDLRRSIRLDPSQPDAYLALASVFGAMGQTSHQREAIRAYLRFMPQNLTLRSVD
jgi:Flp pilus assembly protein TadD